MTKSRTFQHPHGNLYNGAENVTTSTDNLSGYPNAQMKKDAETAAKYQKWTFYVMMAMIVIRCSSIIYVQIKGIPVKIKG